MADLVPPGASMAEVLRNTEGLIGVPIRISRKDLQGPSAVVARGDVAVMVIDSSVEADRLSHIIGHELGHLALGHDGGERRHYDTSSERDAELFGTLTARRMRMPRLSVRSRTFRW